MPVSEAKKRANQKWNAKNYKQINLQLPIDEYNKINEFIAQTNQTRNGFIRNAIKEAIKRETQNHNKDKQ